MHRPSHPQPVGVNRAGPGAATSLGPASVHTHLPVVGPRADDERDRVHATAELPRRPQTDRPPVAACPGRQRSPVTREPQADANATTRGAVPDGALDLAALELAGHR